MKGSCKSEHKNGGCTSLWASLGCFLCVHKIFLHCSALLGECGRFHSGDFSKIFTVLAALGNNALYKLD